MSKSVMKQSLLRAVIAVGAFVLGVTSASIWISKRPTKIATTQFSKRWAPQYDSKLDREQLREEDDPVGIDSRDRVILTVENQDGGMVCNTDKYLRLRVYLSGRIEGDSFDRTEKCHRERKTAMLDDVRLANLRRALERRDLLKCENQYPQFAIETDTYTHSVMTFKIEQEEKSIALTNPESDDPRNIANYPKALIALLQEIDEITEHFEFR